MKFSLWLYPPAPVADDLRHFIHDLSLKGPERPAPFEPHITIVGDIECEDEVDGAKLCDYLEPRLKGRFGRGIQCHFHPNAVSVEGEDTPIHWNQALVAIMRLTPSFMNLVEASRCLVKKPKNGPKFAAPLQVPHMSLYYGSQQAPDPDSIYPVSPFQATELGLWKTDGNGLEGVYDWKEVGRISLV